MAQFHELVAQHGGPDLDPGEVLVGIETDHGLWVQALIAAGYRVFGVNPLQAARFRERLVVSGAKSDQGDAHALADMVRTDAHQLRMVPDDSDTAAAVKVVARAHQTLIWERTRHLERLQHALGEYFPAALDAFDDLAGTDALELLAAAPDPASASRLTSAQITAALRHARRRHVTAKTTAIRDALGTRQLAQPGPVTAAHAAGVRALVAVLATLNGEIDRLEGELKNHFHQHPDVEIILSQPGIGEILGARVLAEFGDDPHTFATPKARKNYAGTSPLTRQSGKRRIVVARWVHNNRLLATFHGQALTAIRVSPGARAYYDRQRDRGLGHHAALRQLANRLVGILHGCLKTHTRYNENTAWPTPQHDQLPDAA